MNPAPDSQRNHHCTMFWNPEDHLRHSRLDSGLDSLAKVVKMCQVVPSLLGNGTARFSQPMNGGVAILLLTLTPHAEYHSASIAIQYYCTFIALRNYCTFTVGTVFRMILRTMIDTVCLMFPSAGNLFSLF